MTTTTVQAYIDSIAQESQGRFRANLAQLFFAAGPDIEYIADKASDRDEQWTLIDYAALMQNVTTTH